jgi:hypothetical protein
VRTGTQLSGQALHALFVTLAQSYFVRGRVILSLEPIVRQQTLTAVAALAGTRTGPALVRDDEGVPAVVGRRVEVGTPTGVTLTSGTTHGLELVKVQVADHCLVVAETQTHATLVPIAGILYFHRLIFFTYFYSFHDYL